MVQQEHDEGLIRENQAEVGLEEELEAIRKELAEVKAKADVNLAGWQRAQADFVNYKRRAEQERLETINFANSVLVSSLLPILDDFERAFKCLPPELDGAAWVEGIRLIERKLRATLEADGLSAIKAVGEPFDPRLHEAVRQAKGEEGIVVEEVQKGYKFRDQVIRPSKVTVGNGEGEEGTGAGQGNSSV